MTPTFSVETFNARRAFVDINLPQGKCVVTVAHGDGCFSLDYICFASIDEVGRNTVTDYSKSFHRIRNKATNNYIAFDTLQSSLLNRLELKSKADDSLSMLRLDCVGYDCWRVACFKHDTIDLCLDVLNYLPDASTPIMQWKYVGGNNQKWMLVPMGNGYFKIVGRDSGLVLTSVTDVETGTEGLEQMPWSGGDEQLWNIIPCGTRAGTMKHEHGFPVVGSAISEAFRIADITSLFEWFFFKGDIPPKASSLIKWRTGECRDETSFVVYLLRAMGIPAAIDFTPHWGNRSRAHTWSVVVSPEGRAVTFYMGATPGDTTNLFHAYKKPKVYRRRYRMNSKILEDLKNEKDIPELFRYPYFYDVTAEYCPTADVTRNVSVDVKDGDVLYVCVFDFDNCVPVHYGVADNGHVTYTSMSKGVMYVSARYIGGEIRPFGNTFYVDDDGHVVDIVGQPSKRVNMQLVRKYPFMGKEDFFNFRMWGGQFQASHSPNFSDATVLYTFEGMTNGNWYDVPVDDSHSYQYLRYIGPKGAFCNINEIEFIDNSGKAMRGKILGTEGVDGAEKEKVFDGDILTGFHSVIPDGGWVGLALPAPRRLGRIRFIPRNDGNCVEVGDTYELVWWNDGIWESLDTIKAENDVLTFHDVPAGALYMLHDLTKGIEERIFTYQNGGQIWW